MATSSAATTILIGVSCFDTKSTRRNRGASSFSSPIDDKIRGRAANKSIAPSSNQLWNFTWGKTVGG